MQIPPIHTSNSPSVYVPAYIQ